VGRPSHKPVVRHKSFLYQAASWTARRVVAKVEFHAGNCFPRGFMVTWEHHQQSFLATGTNPMVFASGQRERFCMSRMMLQIKSMIPYVGIGSDKRSQSPVSCRQKSMMQRQRSGRAFRLHVTDLWRHSLVVPRVWFSNASEVASAIACAPARRQGLARFARQITPPLTAAPLRLPGSYAVARRECCVKQQPFTTNCSRTKFLTDPQLFRPMASCRGTYAAE